MDTKSYVQSLPVSSLLRESILPEMARALRLPKGSLGLDAGCGIGLQCRLLADEVGPTGHVIGLDLSADMLDYGREMVGRADLSGRVSFREGDVTNLPFDDNTFDWAWRVDCAGLPYGAAHSSLADEFAGWGAVSGRVRLSPAGNAKGLRTVFTTKSTEGIERDQIEDTDDTDKGR